MGDIAYAKVLSIAWLKKRNIQVRENRFIIIMTYVGYGILRHRGAEYTHTCISERFKGCTFMKPWPGLDASPLLPMGLRACSSVTSFRHLGYQRPLD
jgi:hypothetical protein